MPYYCVDGVMVHLNFGGKLRKNPPAPCCVPIKLNGERVRCQAISQFLCDHENSDGQTCDAPLYKDHAHETGPDHHLCPRHAQESK